MEITQHPGEELLELRLSGRIDAMWGDHLSSTIEHAVRAGSHHLALNCSGVDYISSLGIGVIVTQYKLLKSVNGSLVVTEPSKFVRQILTTVGLASILIEGETDIAPAAPRPVERRVYGGAAYEVHPQQAAHPLSCTLIGDPSKLVTTGFSAADCQSVALPAGTFALGLGAFGTDFSHCESRFGEFLAADGCAIGLPTGEPDAVPDYLTQQGNLIPHVQALYCLISTGGFSHMVRFDTHNEGPGKVGVSELMTTMLDLSSASDIGFVVLAEAACVVGTSLLKSPALGPIDQRLPGVRDWLSFTTERVSEKALALLVGVAGQNLSAEAPAFVRPIRPGSEIYAHVHAAVFSYRPVQRGELPIAGTISKILEGSNPKSLLHVMADTRPYDGVGETDLARGACWMAPIDNFKRG